MLGGYVQLGVAGRRRAVATELIPSAEGCPGGWTSATRSIAARRPGGGRSSGPRVYERRRPGELFIAVTSWLASLVPLGHLAASRDPKKTNTNLFFFVCLFFC